jgi:hypothetical protein
VNLVEVDHIGAQTPQAALARGYDVRCREPLALPNPGHAARRTGHFGRKHHLLAQARLPGKPTANDGLGRAIRLRTRGHGVHLGRVDEVHATLERPVENRMCFGLADLLAESHGTQANGGHAQITLTEGDGVHGERLRKRKERQV